MKTRLEKVDLSITTIKNSIPTSKAVTGRMRVSADMESATFVEEEGKVILSEGKCSRVYRGQNCSVWYDAEKDEYRIRVTLKKVDNPSTMMAQCDFEECLNYIIRRKYAN